MTIKHTKIVPQSFVDVCLYILMRTDLISMNNGKACAQGSHAANQCVYDIRHRHSGGKTIAGNKNDVFVNSLLVAWEGDRGFGTCITLAGGRINELERRIATIQAAGFHAAMTHDPSYPLRDGDFVHLIPLNTCGYVFGMKHQLAPFLSDLSLLP